MWLAYRRVGRYRTKRGSRRGPVHNSHARAGRACQMSSRATPCPTLAAIARPAIHDAGKRSLHGASPRCRCRVASWERPPSGMSAEIANDRLWPKADIHNSKTIAPILQPCILALSLSQPRSGCAPSAGHGEGMDARVEATQEQLPDGPPLYPGPLCGGESGSTGRAAGVDRDVDSFSHGQDVRSKSPSPAHGLVGQDARQAPSGVAFFLCWLLIFTPGILPSALRAGFAVRARSGRARDHARDK
jgi:hypothetical protein